MRYLSLFSGIEAATVAWHPLGWKPVGFAEIEPFPCAVLEHHYPDVPNLGSVTDITEAMIRKLGPIDVNDYRVFLMVTVPSPGRISQLRNALMAQGTRLLVILWRLRLCAGLDIVSRPL